MERNAFGSIAAVCFFVLVITLFPCLIPVSYAQSDESGDCELGIQPITREEAIQIIEMTPIGPPSRLLGKRLPRRVDLRNEIPPVGQQQDGYTQSCVTFATVYYQMSQMVKRFLHPTWDLSNPNYQFGVQFAFNMGGFGFADEVYKVLMQYGCIDMAEIPYSARNLYQEPTQNQFEAAKPYKIAAYAPLWDNGRTSKDYKEYPFNNPIENAKAWLADGFVLSVSVGASESTFPDNHCTPPAYFYDPVNVPIGDNSGHGVAIVGYNDNINPRGEGSDHKGGFLMVNMWGANWNGNMHGYLWLSYDYVRRYMTDAWIMVPGPADIPVIKECIVIDKVPTTQTLTMAISGENFGSYRRQAQVKFQGFPTISQNTLSWTNEMIVIESDNASCPFGSPVVVYNWDGVPSEPFNFDTSTMGGAN